MDAIVQPLRKLGVIVLGAPFGGERPPVIVERGPPRRPSVDVDASATSQALSALLLIGPALRDGLEVHPAAAAVSGSYLELTRSVMADFGSTCLHVSDAYQGLPGGYTAWSGPIEGDWSGAAYPLAAAALDGGETEIDSLNMTSCQADRRIVALLRLFGASVEETPTGVRVRGGDRRPIDVGLRDAPDLAPLVGALATVASGTTRVRGAAHLRIKESDRIATVVAAARALGCDARELPDGFEIVGPAMHGGLVETKHDHRIAMAFAVAGLAVPGVVIDDPACVAKSYPGFWEDLARLIGDEETT